MSAKQARTERADVAFDESWLNADAWTVMRQSGGIEEFSRTGIYPEKVIFENGKIPFHSERRFNQRRQFGLVRKSGRKFFQFHFREYVCEIVFHDDPQKRVMRLPVAHVEVD